MNLLASQEGTSKPGIKVWEDHDRCCCCSIEPGKAKQVFLVHSSSDDVRFTFITK